MGITATTYHKKKNWIKFELPNEEEAAQLEKYIQDNFPIGKMEGKFFSRDNITRKDKTVTIQRDTIITFLEIVFSNIPSFEAIVLEREKKESAENKKLSPEEMNEEITKNWGYWSQEIYPRNTPHFTIANTEYDYTINCKNENEAKQIYDYIINTVFSLAQFSQSRKNVSYKEKTVVMRDRTIFTLNQEINQLKKEII